MEQALGAFVKIRTHTPGAFHCLQVEGILWSFNSWLSHVAVDSCILGSSVPGPSGVQSPAISAALACFFFLLLCYSGPLLNHKFITAVES